MKKYIFTITFSLFLSTFYGQNASNNLMKHAIQSNCLKNYENVIVSSLPSAFVESILRQLKSNKKVFKSIDYSKTEIHLSSKEKKFIVDSFTAHAKVEWTNEDFANITVIKENQIRDYIIENKKGGYIYISAPIFIRNNSVALIFFVHIYGDLNANGGGINDFSFYKLENGSWKKWITLEAGIYN